LDALIRRRLRCFRLNGPAAALHGDRSAFRNHEKRPGGGTGGHRGKLAGSRSAASASIIPVGISLVPLLNLICTNVPGSPTPRYRVGKRMLSSYPHVSTGYELGVGVAVQSYNGKMCFGLAADAVAAADVKSLRDFIGASWEELCRAAGFRPAARPAARRRRPTAKRRGPKPQPVSVQEPPPVMEPAPTLDHAKIA
jgi:hypothetical protein